MPPGSPGRLVRGRVSWCRSLAPDRGRRNLGSGRGFSVMEVVETARRVTGRKISARRGLRRAGDPAILIASSDRIQEMFGWTPQYPELEAIIDSAWRWLQAHPLGYSPD